MKVSSKQGALVSFIREGDYFVISSTKRGLGVEYAPTGPTEAQIIGAFASLNGRVRFWNAQEAAWIRENYGLSAEDHLVSEVERSFSEVGKQKPLQQRFVDALQTYANAGYDLEPVWDGSVDDFWREVLYPISGTKALKVQTVARALQKTASMVPGITVEKTGSQWFINVRWAAIQSREGRPLGGGV
jgi:hypothetical protein